MIFNKQIRYSFEGAKVHFFYCVTKKKYLKMHICSINVHKTKLLCK
jgi:hypothetical protein